MENIYTHGVISKSLQFKESGFQYLFVIKAGAHGRGVLPTNWNQLFRQTNIYLRPALHRSMIKVKLKGHALQIITASLQLRLQGPRQNGCHRCLAPVNFEILLKKTICTVESYYLSNGTHKSKFLTKPLIHIRKYFKARDHDVIFFSFGLFRHL